MSDDDVHSLVGAYALNALPRDEEAFFERHLAVCEECSREVAELTATTASLGAAAAEPPPAGLRDRVLAEAWETPQERPSSAPSPTRTSTPTPTPTPTPAPAAERWGERLRPVLATAAAVVAVALLSLGTAVVMLADRTSDLEAELAGAQEIMDVVSQPDMRVVELDSPAGTQARLLHGAGGDRAALVLDGLEDVSDDQAYQLWVMHGETPSPDRVFRPNEDGRAIVSVDNDVENADAVAVTVEPRGGSQQPTGEILMLGELGDRG